MSSLTLTDVRRAFDIKVVLDGLSLHLEPGEFTAVLGHSGCGKSTLLRIIAGLDSGYTGVVDSSPEIAMVFQDANLLPWKRVLANVVLGLRGSDRTEKAREVLAEVGLDDNLHQWPSTLSGGEAQRVALARALVRNPKVLLLDEPFGALDALNRLKMQDLLVALLAKYRATTVMVTHDVEEAIALAGRVVVLDGGRFTFDRRIDLPTPRSRVSAAFQTVRADVLDALGVHLDGE